MAPRTALAFSVAALLACVVVTLVPARGQSPSPAPSATLAPLAPLGIDDAAAAPLPESGGVKVLGHIYANALCRTFVEHYNAAAVTILDNDQQIATIDDTLDRLQREYNERDGALRVAEDRVKLVDAVKGMMTSIPTEQREVNELIRQARETKDPERKASLQQSASSLQRTVDRQRAVANDMLNVAQVLMDKHDVKDTMVYQINASLPAGAPPVNLHPPGDAPVPEPGTHFGPPPKNVATVQEVTQLSRQRWIISFNESHAQVAAQRVYRSCVDRTP